MISYETVVNMRKTMIVLLILCAALTLTACAAKTANDVSVYVAPELFGGESVVPESAPSAELPAREKLRRTMPAYQYNAADDAPDTLYTVNMKYNIEEHYFVGEELTFALPEGWNAGNLELRSAEQDLVGSIGRQFLFYLVDSGSAQAALLMKVDALLAEYHNESGVDYGERLGASYDGSHVYIRAAVAGGLPEDFADAELYERLLAEITAEGYEIQINV